VRVQPPPPCAAATSSSSAPAAAQASPYVIFLFALPGHFWTHLGLLFFTGIWTTNIHDTLVGEEEEQGGAGHAGGRTERRTSKGRDGSFRMLAGGAAHG
jgi:hypothetical protein